MMIKYILSLSFCFIVSLVFTQEEKSLEVKEIFDVSYLETDIEEDSLRRLNFFLPQGVDNPPLLIWIGGGAWAYVDRYQESKIAKQFAKEGIAVAAIGHRLSSCVFVDSTRTTGVKHPVHVRDVATAFHWLYDHAKEYGYNADNIFIGGFSSGAQLSALLASDEKYLKENGLSFKNVKGVIPVGGAYDISHYHQAFVTGSRPHLAEEHVKAVFGDTEEDFKDASPSTYIDKMVVPMLLISDQNTFGYTKVFEDKIREDSEYTNFNTLHVHRYTHNELWKKFAEEDCIYRDMVVDFIKG